MERAAKLAAWIVARNPKKKVKEDYAEDEEVPV